jgi:hypothetical protein
VNACINNPVSHEEPARLAMKLREDLDNYEDKLGSCRDFSELKNSADALIVAILESAKLRRTTTSSQKNAQIYEFPYRRGLSSRCHSIR